MAVGRSWLTARLWYLVSRPWIWLVARGLLLVSARSRIDGLAVYDATSGVSGAPLARLHDALELIRTRAPRRYLRIMRDVRRVVIIAAGGPEYWVQIDAIAITLLTLNQSPEDVALAIVHEAMHARIALMGIPNPRVLRERIERICVKAEIAFAQTLPDADGWIAHVQRQLDTPWWTDDAVRERRADAWRELVKPPSDVSQ